MYKIEQPILQDEINEDNEFILAILLLVVSVEIKVIIEKSRGDVSLMEQDTIENVS